MKMANYLFPGSFNPYTIGHHSVYNNAEESLDDRVYIGITQNKNKPEQNAYLNKWITNAAFDGLDSNKVKVVDNNTLIAEYARNKNYSALIRSLRNSIDLVQEIDMATWNKDFDMPTVFIPASNDLDHISSSAIREIASYNKDMSKYFVNQLQYKRWMIKKPKRVIVTGRMGAGKSSFIEDLKDYALDGLQPPHQRNVFLDMDAYVKEKMKAGTAETFKRFFEDTDTQEIRQKWNHSSLDGVKREVTDIILNRIKGSYGVFEVSALTSYELEELYEDSIIVFIQNYHNGKQRDINTEMMLKFLHIQDIPKVVDFYIDDRMGNNVDYFVGQCLRMME
jgi:pantetheine-phosphate adenylyltransferase